MTGFVLLGPPARYSLLGYALKSCQILNKLELVYLNNKNLKLQKYKERFSESLYR